MKCSRVSQKNKRGSHFYDTNTRHQNSYTQTPSKLGIIVNRSIFKKINRVYKAVPRLRLKRLYSRDLIINNPKDIAAYPSHIQDPIRKVLQAFIEDVEARMIGLTPLHQGRVRRLFFTKP